MHKEKQVLDTEFERSITSARLPKYRIDPKSGLDSAVHEQPLLEDIYYEERRARRKQLKKLNNNSSPTSAAGGKGKKQDSTNSNNNETDSDDDSDLDFLREGGGDEDELQKLKRRKKSEKIDNPEELAAWRLQIRAIFFPRAHIFAQQQKQQNRAGTTTTEQQQQQTVAVLDQSTEWFEALSLFLTVANIIVVAVDDPTTPETDARKVALDKFDTFFSLFYLFEMIIRIVSFGIQVFWADAFNRLDAVVVAFGIASLSLKLTSSGLANITFVRALRVLRPLRTMTQFRQTRLTVASVIGSFRELLDVWLLFMVFFGVLCVLAIDPFRGVLRNYCFSTMYENNFQNLPPLTVNTSINNTEYTSTVKDVAVKLQLNLDPHGILKRYTTRWEWRSFVYNLSLRYNKVEDFECGGQFEQHLGFSYAQTNCSHRHCSNRDGSGRFCPYGYECDKVNNPEFGFIGFDNLFVSALTTFVLLTTSSWARIYTMMYDASTGLAGLYCVFAVIVGRYFVVSIIIAIVTDRFREKHRQQQLIMQEQEKAAARASKRIRVKSIIETSIESLERYFARLRMLEEIEIHHDFASALEEDVLVRRTSRDWDNFRYVDEDLYDTQASMIRRSASMVAALGGDSFPSSSSATNSPTSPISSAATNVTAGAATTSFSSLKKRKSSNLQGSKDNNNNNNNNKDGKDNKDNSTEQMLLAKEQGFNFEKDVPILTRGDSGTDSSKKVGPTHYALDQNARRRRWFAREIILKKWFLSVRILVSLVTFVYLATEFEGVENNELLARTRLVASFVVLCWWTVELLLRGLSRRWLLLVTDAYFVVECFCILFLALSLVANFGKQFGSLSESFFLGRFSVFLSEAYRITPLYRWIRIIVAAFRSSIVLICIILLALFLLACTGMQVFGAQFCDLETPHTVEENIALINSGKCNRPRSNFDSFHNAIVSAFQLLTGDKWEQIMYAGMQSIWNRNMNAGGLIVVGIISVCFVAAFVVLNYLFANLFISILLNSRAVNEDELRRDAIRIQREVHYSKLLARRQLQLEAGLYDVAAVASALFNFNQFFKNASNQSKKVIDMFFSEKVFGRLARWRQLHVFSTIQAAAIGLCSAGLAMARPITPPDTQTHWFGLMLIHISTGASLFRLICELVVESYKMRMRKLEAKKRKARLDMFDFDEDEATITNAASNSATAAASGGGGGGGVGGIGSDKSKGDDGDKDDIPLFERYALFHYFGRSGWHVFEALLTCAGIVFGAMRIFFQTYNMVVFACSCILCFRPIGFMEKAQGLKIVLRDIAHMLRNLACILVLIFFFYILYSLLGVQLLRGRMSICHGNETIKVADNCTHSGRRWGPVALHFDDLLAASYTLYAVATLSDWSDIFYQAQAAGHSSFVAFLVNIYFFFFIIAGGLFAQSLVTMMLIDTFEVRRLGGTDRVSKQDQVRAITNERFSAQQKLVARIVPREVKEMRRTAFTRLYGGGANNAAAGGGGGGGFFDSSPSHNNLEETEETAKGLQGLGQRGLRMTQTAWFRWLITILIFLSFCVSASYRHPMSEFWTDFNYWADVLFTILFSLELILYLLFQTLCVDLPKGTKWYKRLPLRIISGWNVHFSSKWNWFDAVIVLLSVLGLTLERYAKAWAWTKNFRALRALRLLRLVKNNPRIAGMVSRLGTALKQLFHVSMIFLFSFFSFGLLGMRLFGHIKLDGYVMSDRVGFTTVDSSLVMMMRIATLNRWPAVVNSLSVQQPDCLDRIGECGNHLGARIFMFFSTVIFGFVLSNMFVAVLVDAYMSRRLEHQVLSQCALTQREITEFAEKFVTWPSMDPVYFTIPSDHVVPFLRYLRRSSLLSDLNDNNNSASDNKNNAAGGGGGGKGGEKKDGKDGGGKKGDNNNKNTLDNNNNDGDSNKPSRVHPFALPVCDLKWRQPQWDLLAVQQLGLKEYSPGLIDYWSLINALCDLRFVRDVTTRNEDGASVSVKAGVLERSKEKMLKRKFLLKVPARQQQLLASRKKGGSSSKKKVEDDLDDNVDEEDEEVNPVVDDGWDNAVNSTPRHLLEVYSITRLREIMLSMPRWRGFMMENASVEQASKQSAAAAAAAVAGGSGSAAVVGGVVVDEEDELVGQGSSLFADSSMAVELG